MALDPTTGGAISVATVAVAAITGIYVAVANRASAKAQISDDHFSRALTGFKDLLDAQDERIDDLEALVRELRMETARARDEATKANAHAVECERDLAAAKRRITELEANR